MTKSLFSHLEVWRARFPLRLKFSHHLAIRDEAESLILVAKTFDGHRGFGQVLPRSYLTGETLDSSMSAIRDRWWPRLIAVRPPAISDFSSCLDAFRPLFAEADQLRLNASYAAVEAAALDAMARRFDFSLTPVGDTRNANTPLVGVIGAMRPGRAAWLARVLKWLGYRRFKVKMGADGDADARLLEAVRGVIGPTAWLAVDANQAWEPEEAERRAKDLRRFGVSLIEEPVVASSGKGFDYAELERLLQIDVMADESICTIADADELLKHGSPSWWNLRFGKNGGFAGVVELGKMARDNNINVYGGVLVGETSALAAAGWAALPRAGVACMEYGFPRFFLKGDPFRGGPGGFRGTMTVPPISRPGLGVSLKAGLLERVAVREWIGKV